MGITHSKVLVAPDSGSEDKVYGSDYVAAGSHTVGSLPLVGVTFANLPSSGVATGEIYFVTNLGANGTLMQWTGTRWRALNGTATLAQLGAIVTGVANSETIEVQTLIPAGAWQTNDTLRIWGTFTKSGTTNSCNISVRVGTAGTTSDTAITGLSNFIYLTAAQTSGGQIVDIKLTSATAAQRIGLASTGAGSYTGGNAAAAAASTTITDASANALYISLSILSSGATDTVGIASGQIQLITP